MKTASVKRYFDADAEEYLCAHNGGETVRSFIFQERARIVFELFDVRNGTVLDVGCGPAVHTEALLQRGCTVIGVDISESMIALAKSRQFPRTAFLVGNVEQVPIQEKTMDGVLCSGVLEYLDHAEATIREIGRVTKPGGTVILTVPNKASHLNKLDGLLRWVVRLCHRQLKIRALGCLITSEYAPQHFDLKSIEPLLNKYGLVVEDFRFHIFRLSFLNKICPRLSFWITRRMNFVSSPRLGVNLVVKARKEC